MIPPISPHGPVTAHRLLVTRHPSLVTPETQSPPILGSEGCKRETGFEPATLSLGR